MDLQLLWPRLPGRSYQGCSSTTHSERTPEDVIREQLAPFNAHSPDAMVANLHDGFAWFAVDSDVTTLETQGRGTFHQSMLDYFAQIPGARSEIEDLFVAGSFVTALERAHWMQNGVEVSQASLSIYEIRQSLIYRVWYYPAFG